MTIKPYFIQNVSGAIVAAPVMGAMRDLLGAVPAFPTAGTEFFGSMAVFPGMECRMGSVVVRPFAEQVREAPRLSQSPLVVEPLSPSETFAVLDQNWIPESLPSKRMMAVLRAALREGEDVGSASVSKVLDMAQKEKSGASISADLLPRLNAYLALNEQKEEIVQQKKTDRGMDRNG